MREDILFNDGWRFMRGSLPVSPVLSKEQTYTGIKTGQLYPIFNDDALLRGFDPVSLPHDYVIGDVPDRAKNEALGFLRGDEGWYYKKFTLDASDAERVLSLYFEGIATETEIFLNGTRLRRNFSAYNPIYVDITDFVRFDAVNILVVHVKAPEVPEGWWYEGGGIYRDVRMIKTEKIAVAPFGIYVKTEKKEDGTWRVSVETTVRNACKSEKDVTLRHTIFSPDGEALSVLGTSVRVGSKDVAVQTVSGTIDAPQLWDIDSPALYTVKTELLADAAVTDEYTTRFGFRTIHFDADKGFFLNGRHVYIKGFCAHQDFGLSGIYLPKSAARYRMKLMKDMGANAYRSAHNLSDEYTMDVCDELGILVLDETRYFASTDEGLGYVRDMLLRDRNHPCVIAWSVGNEEFNIHLDTGVRICETMRDYVRTFDDRPVAMAMNEAGGAANNLAGGAVDVIGYNYGLKDHDMLHAKFPGKPFVMTESCALATSRGQYFGDDGTGMLYDARDHANPAAWNPDTMSDTWRHITSRPYECGMFIWAGIEHRGETVWPRLCSQSGMVDLYLQPKEAYYHLQSLYAERPVIHICPSSWNFAGLEGQIISVEVYTNAVSAELFLNGESLGSRTFENCEPCRFNVPYTPGTLTAVAYDADGAELCRDEVSTTGSAVSLKLICLNEYDVRNGGDCAIFSCVCLDADGKIVPDAAPTVRFSVNGGILLGTGSSDFDHVPPRFSVRKMYAGKISAAVRLTDAVRMMRVCAEADGLKRGSITIAR